MRHERQGECSKREKQKKGAARAAAERLAFNAQPRQADLTVQSPPRQEQGPAGQCAPAAHRHQAWPTQHARNTTRIRLVKATAGGRSTDSCPQLTTSTTMRRDLRGAHFQRL